MPNAEDPPAGALPLPLPERPRRYGERFVEALRVAALLHAAQARKGTSIPYVAHLLGSCAIALEHGASEDEAIAALFHDALEDLRPTADVRATVRRFGAEVARIVEACTDSDSHPKPPWRERKERYLAHLAEADRAVLLVSASDKLHNARAIVADLRRHGPPLWDRSTVPREASLCYYRALVTAFRANPAHDPALIDELDRTITEMQRLAGGGGGEGRALEADAARAGP